MTNNDKDLLQSLISEVEELKGIGINSDVRNFRDSIIDDILALLRKKLK